MSFPASSPHRFNFTGLSENGLFGCRWGGCSYGKPRNTSREFWIYGLRFLVWKQLRLLRCWRSECIDSVEYSSGEIPDLGRTWRRWWWNQKRGATLPDLVVKSVVVLVYLSLNGFEWAKKSLNWREKQGERPSWLFLLCLRLNLRA